jgi:anti-anti-sigma factor
VRASICAAANFSCRISGTMADVLTISVSDGRHAGHRVMRMQGPLSLETVPAFLKEIRAEKSPVVILDFTNVSLIDSAGVGALIQTHVAFAKSQRTMALAAVNARNMAVFEITRVAKALRIFASVQDAETVT